MRTENGEQHVVEEEREVDEGESEGAGGGRRVLHAGCVLPAPARLEHCGERPLSPSVPRDNASFNQRAAVRVLYLIFWFASSVADAQVNRITMIDEFLRTDTEASAPRKSEGTSRMSFACRHNILFIFSQKYMHYMELHLILV